MGTGSSVGALRAFAPVLLVLSCDLLLQALSAFRRAGTTVDPIRIQHAFALMTGRFDAFTHNAMCLGMILLLAAWALWLGGAVVWVGPMALAICLDRFRIGPGERVIAARFGA